MVRMLLPFVRGRATGVGEDGVPEFRGVINSNGLVRIDCLNYPEHWQELQLPPMWVKAWKQYTERPKE